MNPDSSASRLPSVRHRAFTSFSSSDFRIYFFAATAAMMADNIEHVISYWVMFQKFHSPALGAFAVVSHWVPFLLLGAYSGRLADRFDIRRLIQIGMLLFIGVSISWGVMFMTDSTTVGKAMALLVIHGLAGVLWGPAAQVLIHRIVSVEQLPSAVRLTATGRYLGFLVGPIVGDGLLQIFGSSYGILINALIYCPLSGDDLVLRPVWFRPVEYLRRGDHPIVRRWLRRIEFQFHGAVAGSAERAGRHARARGRGIFDVCVGVAHLQRTERRLAGLDGRHS